jgi:hypothetical protein
MLTFGYGSLCSECGLMESCLIGKVGHIPVLPAGHRFLLIGPTRVSPGTQNLLKENSCKVGSLSPFGRVHRGVYMLGEDQTFKDSSKNQQKQGSKTQYGQNSQEEQGDDPHKCPWARHFIPWI